jgi:hypothetical protein
LKFQKTINTPRNFQLLKSPFEQHVSHVRGISSFLGGKRLELMAEILRYPKADLCFPLAHQSSLLSQSESRSGMNGKAILMSLQESGHDRKKESKAVDIATRAKHRMNRSTCRACQ